MLREITLYPPIVKSPLESPAVKIGEAYLTIDYAGWASGRRIYRWQITHPKFECFGEDIHSGIEGGSLEEGMRAFLSFLCAFSDAWYWGDGELENSHIFPVCLNEWAVDNHDEIVSMCWDLQNQSPLIVEEYREVD